MVLPMAPGAPAQFLPFFFEFGSETRRGAIARYTVWITSESENDISGREMRAATRGMPLLIDLIIWTKARLVKVPEADPGLAAVSYWSSCAMCTRLEPIVLAKFNESRLLYSLSPA